MPVQKKTVRKIQAEQYPDILNDSKQGMSLRHIAEKYGVSHQAISNILKRFDDYVVDRNHNSIPEDQYEELRMRRERGDTMKSIAAHFGVAYTTVKATLMRQDMWEPRTPGFTDEECVKLLIRYRQGATRRELSTEHDFPASTITAAMRKGEKLANEQGIAIPPKATTKKRTRRRNLTDQEISEIRQAIHAGGKDFRIAADFNIDECTVYRIRRLVRGDSKDV